MYAVVKSTSLKIAYRYCATKDSTYQSVMFMLSQMLSLFIVTREA